MKGSNAIIYSFAVDVNSADSAQPCYKWALPSQYCLQAGRSVRLQAVLDIRILSDDDMAILTAQIIVRNATGQFMVLVGANGPARMVPLPVGANGCAIVQICAPSRFRDF